MPTLDCHQALLQRQWNEESQVLERRRQHLINAAAEAALALRQRWPSVESVWLFGSTAATESFRRHSDLDLTVAGLPQDCQLEALALVERILDGALVAAGEDGISIDLVRLEDLEPHWQRRIDERGLCSSCS